MSQVKQSLICLILLLIPFQSVTIAQSDEELVIFAASSLTNAFTELGEVYENAYNVQVTLNFAGSSTLAAQLIQGASADIFVSANMEQLQTVIDEMLIDAEQATIFAENELALIVPSDNPAQIQSVRDLGEQSLLLALAAPSVPIREYTDQLFLTLADDYGEAFPDEVLRNLVSEESNVRQIVTRVVLGEVDAGIVYRTDITPDVEDDVLIIPLPDGVSPRAQYPIAPLLDTPYPDLANSFVDFVLSDEGQNLLNAWGFCSPEIITPEQTPEPESTPDLEVMPDVDATC